MRDTWAVVLLIAAMVSPVTAGGQGSNYKVQANPDSEFTLIRSRLAQHKYREDAVDAPNRWMIVIPPSQKTKVAIRVEATHDSANVKIEPVDAKDLIAALQAIVLVTADAALEPEKPGGIVMPPNGDLPPAQWRPELFLSPLGHLWIARSGLFTTDSLMGAWKLSLDPQHAGVKSIDLSIGTRMAFVDEDTMFVGLHPYLYRSTNSGKSWSRVTTGQIEGVDALEAVGGSVWGFARYFDHEERLTAFLRTSDGGVTWTRAPLPGKLRDVTHVYRLSAAEAYVATTGDSTHPAFWLATDSGRKWLPLPTPRDQKVNDVPSDGVRIESIATVGRWLVVREYGKVFVTGQDTVHWRQLPDLSNIAADRDRDHLFALTTHNVPEMLDTNLTVIWQGHDKIPKPDDIEGILAKDGAGYIFTSFGAIYEARDGVLRVRQPRP